MGQPAVHHHGDAQRRPRPGVVGDAHRGRQPGLEQLPGRRVRRLRGLGRTARLQGHPGRPTTRSGPHGTRPSPTEGSPSSTPTPARTCRRCRRTSPSSTRRTPRRRCSRATPTSWTSSATRPSRSHAEGVERVKGTAHRPGRRDARLRTTGSPGRWTTAATVAVDPALGLTTLTDTNTGPRKETHERHERHHQPAARHARSERRTGRAARTLCGHGAFPRQVGPRP